MTCRDGPLADPLDPGADNELRLRRRLWSDGRALRSVRELGLVDATIRRFRLGLREPYLSRDAGLVIERALSFPVLAADGTRESRWGYLNLEGVTAHPPHPVGWGPGTVRTCWSRPVTPGATLLVVPSATDMWLVAQAMGEAWGSLVIACPSWPGGPPPGWRDPRFWRGWDRVVLGLSGRADDEDLVGVAGRAADRELHRCAPAGGERWADLVRTGGSAAEIRRLISDAPRWLSVASLPSSASAPAQADGDYEADPVAIEGAFVGGRMHHPVTVERRELEQHGTGAVEVVQRYVTRVLRSDGVLLDVVRLPAPRGTPASGRVLALSDGTRIVSAPQPGRFGTWRFASIRDFIAAREAGREPARRHAARLLADVEAQMRATVWLPHAEDYALAALFVMATFVHRVFDAFPILLVNGPKGTGKSELGQAVAALSCNGLVAGRVTPAGLVRLLAESRGTVVLDDLEAVGAGRGSDDLVQILKTSYKASTARRVTPGRDGRVEVVDYFAPKVVTNIAGADPVLLSRMLPVRTGAMPDGVELGMGVADVAALRDELHTWAMCDAAAVADAYAPLRDATRDRRAEIAAPLRAVAAVVGIPDVARRLEEALSAEPDIVAEPIDTVLRRLVRRIVEEEGAVELAMPRILLEIASASGGSLRLPSAESLGRLLIANGAREAEGEVSRRRLHGEVVRVYRLSERFVERFARPSSPAPDAFTFCAAPCVACAYEAVCAAATPGLREAKERRVRASSG